MKNVVHKRYPLHHEDVESSIVNVSKEEYLGLKELVRTLRKRIDELEKERMKHEKHNEGASGQGGGS